MYLYQTSVALATNTEAYCSCNSTLHATYDKIHTTCTNKTIPNGPFSHSWSNNIIIMPGIILLCLKFPFYLMHSHVCVLNLFNHVYMRTENIIIIAVIINDTVTWDLYKLTSPVYCSIYKFTFVLMSSIAVELVHYP